MPAPSTAPGPMGPRTIDIGGYHLEIRCEGEGAPTVVFESGAMPFIDVFTAFKEEAARDWRVCSYDRAGTGKSESGPTPRTAQQIASEFDRLLTAAGEQGPFVLVPLSVGALYSLTYAQQYPDRVRAMVFIDPRLPAYHLAVPGVLDDPEKAALIAKFPEPYRLEYDTWNEDARRIIAGGSLPDIPITVLTAAAPDQVANFKSPWDDFALWQQAHADFAASVPHGRHVIVDDAGHMIFQRNPGAVLEALRQVITDSE